MMELEYSPRHSPGNAAHLLSPGHAHGILIDGFASIQQIRRSLSRSPSKPGRCSLQLGRAASASPSLPLLPLSQSRTQSATPANDPLAKSRYSAKRNISTRAASRKSSPNSAFRRALSDNSSQANARPVASRRTSTDEDQENMDCSTDDNQAISGPSFDGPLKIDFLKPDKFLQPVRNNSASPMKSSPLKRSDGVMDLEAASFGSPRNKRRSLHGASLASDFNIFEHGMDGTQSDSAESTEEKDSHLIFDRLHSTRTPATSPPQRRPSSLRKSTLQQRTVPAKIRPATDASSNLALSPSLTRARSRMSLDSALPMRSFDVESSFSRSSVQDPPVLFPAAAHRLHQSAPKPHPLSNALTLSSSSSSMHEDQPQSSHISGSISNQSSDGSNLPPSFSKSLPIGALRPSPRESADSSQQPSQESFATPSGYKMAKPLPQAFMSTGLISKRNRNMDMAAASLFSSVHMPDTPSKKAHVLLPSSPVPTSALGGVSQPAHEFGSPSTPFNARTSKISPQSFGKGVSIFGTRAGGPAISRRASFLSIDGEDVSNSPTRQFESQSSNDDLPPTPTKSMSTTSRPQSKGKNNSLRSSLFGRTSLGADTFVSPTEGVASAEHHECEYDSVSQTPRVSPIKEPESRVDDASMPFITLTACTPSSPSRGRSRSMPNVQDVTSPSPHAKRPPRLAYPFETPSHVYTKTMNFAASSPDNEQETAQKHSPKTPNELQYPTETATRPTSDEQRPNRVFASSVSFPPATPTGPRDQPFKGSLGQGHASSSYFSNDVDTSLTSRFGSVTTLGIGEFSQVYRVENPTARGLSTAQHVLTPAGNVWAVKKSRNPYAGNKDRQRKMREVHILKALRGHEHVIELIDEWESKNYLYIQTEFCENGNLMDFLIQTGYKGRLDDFRIWKILLELSQGVKSIHDANFIHLDLKPANVFIDWEGVLKIGDFGLASTWPAPAGLDGEGDREYIGPEVLSGRFDRPADIFSLGMVMLEIAGNIVLPDNGTSWQRLRAGDMSDLPSLTWSSNNSLVRNESGDPIELLNGTSNDSLCISNPGDDDLSFLRPTLPKLDRAQDLVKPPNFMVDPSDPEALDRVVQWMICPDPDRRPVIDQLLSAGGVQWVDHRRRAGATVYEGNWGPADDVLNHGEDVEMLDI